MDGNIELVGNRPRRITRLDGIGLLAGNDLVELLIDAVQRLDGGYRIEALFQTDGLHEADRFVWIGGLALGLGLVVLGIVLGFDCGAIDEDDHIADLHALADLGVEVHQILHGDAELVGNRPRRVAQLDGIGFLRRGVRILGGFWLGSFLRLRFGGFLRLGGDGDGFLGENQHLTDPHSLADLGVEVDNILCGDAKFIGNRPRRIALLNGVGFLQGGGGRFFRLVRLGVRVFGRSFLLFLLGGFLKGNRARLIGSVLSGF